MAAVHFTTIPCEPNLAHWEINPPRRKKMAAVHFTTIPCEPNLAHWERYGLTAVVPILTRNCSCQV